MADIHLSSEGLSRFPCVRTGSRDVDLRSITAVLTNHFLVPTAARSRHQELFWSEWTALFAHLLSDHQNVFNPPGLGSWCGSFPTAFEQISILQDALRAEDILYSSPLSLVNALWNQCGLRDPDPTALFCALPACFLDRGTSSSGASEIVVPFFDEFLVCPEQYIHFRERLRKLAREFQRHTGCRMGQLRLVADDESIAFYGALARPNPDLCLPEVWSEFSRELTRRILFGSTAE